MRTGRVGQASCAQAPGAAIAAAPAASRPRLRIVRSAILSPVVKNAWWLQYEHIGIDAQSRAARAYPMAVMATPTSAGGAA
jgi:hypothetical protein